MDLTGQAARATEGEVWLVKVHQALFEQTTFEGLTAPQNLLRKVKGKGSGR